MLVNDHLVRYPLLGRDLVTQMGLRSGIRGLASFFWPKLRNSMAPVNDSESFSDWGRRQFGRYWYELFFDGYVRKTWLTNPENLASEWANQRIKPIGWHRSREPDPLGEDAFRYPVHGPGQLWEAAAKKLADAGVDICLNCAVTKIHHTGRSWTMELQNGETVSGDAVFSSMPLRNLIDTLEPEPPHRIRATAATLRHRAVITVAVALQKRYDIPYNWVYTPGKNVRVGRIQNYGRWSSALAPADWNGTYLGLEYFTLPEDDLWVASSESLGAIVEQDLRELGVADSPLDNVIIVRSQFAYPIDDKARERGVARIRDYLRQKHPTLHPIGRNGMHRYDNQDHAMLSAMHSVSRYMGENVDPWQVNTGRSYHEAGLKN